MEAMDSFSSQATVWSKTAMDLMSTNDNIIDKMDWELKAAQSLGISHSEFRYVFAFFLSLAAGAGINLFRSPTMRHIYSTLSGIFLLMYPFGNGVRQVIFPAVLTYAGMVLLPSKSGIIAWLVCFPYLIWQNIVCRHMMNASQVKWNQGELDFVACDMVLVLKLIGLATCYQDSFRKKEDLRPGQEERKLVRLPSILEYVSFIFCLGNLLGGPFLEFKAYKDFIEDKELWKFSGKRRRPSPVLPGLYLVAQALCFMISHILLVPNWGLKNIFSDFYNAQPLLARFGMQVLCGFSMQMKYYFVWKLSEASLTFAGLNLMGLDEATGKATWGRCSNVNFLGMWLCDSARRVPHSWNIGASTFLKRYVYERISPPNGRPSFIHVLITQLTSAFWHGLHPGYVIFFVGTAFYLNTASVIYKLEQQRFFPAALRNASLWWFAKVVWTGTSLTYLAMSFIVLDYDRSVRIYSDIYFIPHLIMLAFFFLGFLLPSPPRQAQRAKKDL